MYGTVLSVGDFDRKGVLIVGTFPLDTTPFIERNLFVKNFTSDTLATARYDFNRTRAIIIAEYPSKYALIKQFFEQLFPDIQNYGITLRILVHNVQYLQQIKAILNETPADHFFFINEVNILAEQVARYSPGPPVQNITIEGDISNIDQEAQLLLARSFYDCTKIYVEQVPGGKDAKHLLKVHAWMKNSQVISSMLPFFVKISSPDKIDKELDNYRVYTDLYLSFRYRPNCRIERCVRTKKYKSLVGNFVDDSISLRKALEDTYHTGIIHSLFEKSLRGFRRQPFVSQQKPSAGALREFIKGRIKIDELVQRNDVISKAKELGLKSDILQLTDTLLAICTESCKTGPIHGDLHSGNVMVSGHDAILIDFSAIKASGPLTADPATLEISLCFDLGEKVPPSFENWKTFIDEAYHPSQILRPLAFTDQIPNEFSWLRRAIREIRHILIGCDCCTAEIEVIIACYLIRIARLAPIEVKRKEDDFEFKCRAYALVVAERIILFLDKKTT